MSGSAGYGARPLHSEEPMPKMGRMDDDWLGRMRPPSPEFDRRPKYMEEEQVGPFRLDNRGRPVAEDRDRHRWEDEQGRIGPDHRSGLMGGQMPDRNRQVVSIFDISDELRREDVEIRGPAGNRMHLEQFGIRRQDEEERMAMQQRNQPMRGSVESSMISWNDERDQPVPYGRPMEEDRRRPPKNQPVPSLLDRNVISDRQQQQRMPAFDSRMMRDISERPGRERPSPSMQDNIKETPYYKNESESLPSSRPSILEHGYDRDDRNTWASDRSEHFEKFKSEEATPTKRQSAQGSQGSEQSDPVSLLLNLSQLLA